MLSFAVFSSTNSSVTFSSKVSEGHVDTKKQEKTCKLCVNFCGRCTNGKVRVAADMACEEFKERATIGRTFHNE